jgi:hypothetical protein
MLQHVCTKAVLQSTTEIPVPSMRADILTTGTMLIDKERARTTAAAGIRRSVNKQSLQHVCANAVTQVLTNTHLPGSNFDKLSCA